VIADCRLPIDRKAMGQLFVNLPPANVAGREVKSAIVNRQLAMIYV